MRRVIRAKRRGRKAIYSDEYRSENQVTLLVCEADTGKRALKNGHLEIE
jgi:hypothetical protein